jgi:exodeoxyribonuclease V
MLTADDKKIRTVDAALELLAQGISSAIQTRMVGRDMQDIIAECPNVSKTGQTKFLFALTDPSTMLSVAIHHSGLLGAPEGDFHKLRDFRNAVVHKRRSAVASTVSLDREAVRTSLTLAIATLTSMGQPNEAHSVKRHLAYFIAGAPDPWTWSDDPVLDAVALASPKKPPSQKTKKGKTLPPFQGLSSDQQAAVDRVVQWFGGSLRRFTISGAAGTGKTWVIPAVLVALKLTANELRIIAPTRKACDVLKVKLSAHRNFASKVGTMQSLLYRYAPPAWDGEDVMFESAGLKQTAEGVRLVVCDEASMLTNVDVIELEKQYRVVYFGDAAQLPPVIDQKDAKQAGRVPAGILLNPDVTLSVVHRQSSGSSILEASEIVRSGLTLEPALWDDDATQVLSEDEMHVDRMMFQDLVKNADAVLVARNITRIRINQLIRRLRNYEAFPGDSLPKPGERLVVQDKTSDRDFVGQPLLNSGQHLIVDEIHGIKEILKVSTQEQVRCIDLTAHFEDNVATRGRWDVSEEMLLGRHIVGDKVVTKGIAGPRSKILRCEWGYAVTVHKAQGSEWSRVVVVDHRARGAVGNREWDYVAITRAKKQVTVIRLRCDSALLM